jgi:hypothetical protein
VGTAIACDIGIFRILSGSDEPLNTEQVVKKGAKGDPLLVERALRFLAAHGFVDQQESGAYVANAMTRDYATEERVANVWTM